MVDFRYTLPFPRGSTMSDFGTVSIDTTNPEWFYDNLCGRVYEAPDTVHNLPGRQVKLRVVRNHSGSAITVARKFMKYTTANGETERYCAGVATKGGYGKPLDDAYTVNASIPVNDLFYVVEQGPCDILNYITASTTEHNLQTPGYPVKSGPTGRLDGAAVTTGDYVLGVVDEHPATTTTATFRIIVEEGRNIY